MVNKPEQEHSTERRAIDTGWLCQINRPHLKNRSHRMTKPTDETIHSYLQMAKLRRLNKSGPASTAPTKTFRSP